MEGSLRATGSRLQVNAQLIDAETGAHVWADRFETDGNDLSAAEAEITGRLLWDLRLNLFAAASSRAEQDGRSDGNAKTIAMRGWSVFHRPRSAANIQEALQLWERALETDPRSMRAKIGIALALVSNFWHGWSRSFEPDEARAERLLLEVFAVDPTDITARIAMGILRRLRGRLDESRIELESVPALDRNIAGLRQLGATLVYLGQPEPAIQHLERSIRLSPYEANIGLNYAYVGLCHLLLGHLDKALNHLRMARTSNPGSTLSIYIWRQLLGSMAILTTPGRHWLRGSGSNRRSTRWWLGAPTVLGRPIRDTWRSARRHSTWAFTERAFPSKQRHPVPIRWQCRSLPDRARVDGADPDIVATAAHEHVG